jgi:putative hydrolase of the HAD superfamily
VFSSTWTTPFSTTAATPATAGERHALSTVPGCRLALLTNGAADAQRRKISRFGLASLFDVILVEGEVGFGKPDERIYRLALRELNVDPQNAWMVGDNLEWDVAAPQKLGLFTVWIDRHGKGLPAERGIRPDRIMKALSELRDEVA